MVPWVSLQFVIVVFPDHTHLLFFIMHYSRNATKICDNCKNFELWVSTSKQLNGISNILLAIVIMHFEAIPIQNTKDYPMKCSCKFLCLESRCLALNKQPAVSK